jgi:FkbM family methyltransferase
MESGRGGDDVVKSAEEPELRARRAAGRGLAALRRLVAIPRARWAVRHERLLTAEFVGSTLYYPSESVIGRGVAEGHGWEPTLAIAVDHVLSTDEALLVADVGSNIGTSLAQLIAIRPNASFVCFEPSPRFRAVLNRNISENGWRNVTVEDVLLGSQSGTMRLFTNTSTASVVRRNYGGHFFLGATERKVVRLDDYFADARRLDLIKSDTDGFDIDVLIGAEGLLSKLAPALYFEFAPFLARDAGRDAGGLLDYLARLGYRVFLVFAQAGDLLARTDEPARILELADEHQYVDLFSAARVEQVEVFPKIAAALNESP